MTNEVKLPVQERLQAEQTTDAPDVAVHVGEIATRAAEQQVPVGRFRRFLAIGALVSSLPAAAVFGAASANAEHDPQRSIGGFERIHANNGEGYSFDKVIPRKVSSQYAHKKQLTVAIEGDSLSAITDESIYNLKPGSDREVWFTRLLTALNLKASVFSQGSSGYLSEGRIYPDSKPNKKDNGTDIPERLKIEQISNAVKKSDMYWIVAGFNDKAKSKVKLREAVSDYFQDVKALRDQAGHHPSTVIVGSLWAQSIDPKQRKKVLSILETEAQKYGFTYVDLDAFDVSETMDGVHYEGNKVGDRIAMQFRVGAKLVSAVEKLRLPQQPNEEPEPPVPSLPPTTPTPTPEPSPTAPTEPTPSQEPSQLP